LKALAKGLAFVPGKPINIRVIWRIAVTSYVYFFKDPLMKSQQELSAMSQHNKLFVFYLDDWRKSLLCGEGISACPVPVNPAQVTACAYMEQPQDKPSLTPRTETLISPSEMDLENSRNHV
jgi:hypothetical protein